MSMKKSLLLRVGLVLLLVALGTAVRADEKLPVPSADEQAASLELIKSIFEKQYASTKAEDKVTLGRELLKQAESIDDDPSAVFVLYREAITTASRVGDVDTALAAQDGMIAGYQVRPITLKSHVLTSLAKTVEGIEPHKKVVRACVDAAQQSAGAEEFDRALQLANIANTLARKTKDLALLKSAKDAMAQIQVAKKEFDKVGLHAEKLKKNPDDAEANLALGRYRCFAKGDWDAGLPLLAKGGDEALASLAKKALEDPKEAMQQYNVARAWWDFGKGLGGTERDMTQAYAAGWFRRALPGLTGLQQQIAQKRVSEAKSVAALTPAGGGGRVVDLIKLIDPEKDALHGKWSVEAGKLVCSTGGFVPKVQIPYQPPEEYDYKIVFSQPRLRNPVYQGMPGKGGSFYWALGGSSGSFILYLRGPDGRELPERRVAGAFVPNRMYTSVVQVRKGGLRILVNGTLMAALKTDFMNPVSNSWYRQRDATLLAVGCDDPTVFHVVEVTEISGPGKKIREGAN